MKIDPIAFYPCKVQSKKSVMIGTMHIRVHIPDSSNSDHDVEFDIRGIRIFQKKDKLLFFQNRGCYYDDQGKIKHYPTFSFNSLEKNKEFLEALQRIGRQYIEANFSKCILKPPY